VALVGPTGVGKTTMANLIPRFYDPTEGRVLIDGIDVKSITVPSLRRQISMVLMGRQDWALIKEGVDETRCMAQ